MARSSDKRKRSGRPRGASDKQAEVRRLIEQGVPPLEAHQRAGYQQPYRAMKRNSTVVAEATHKADPIATLKSQARFGAVADKVRACEALLMYADDQKVRAASPVVFVVDARNLKPEQRRGLQIFTMPAQLDEALRAHDALVASSRASVSTDADGFSALDVLNDIIVRGQARDSETRAACVALLRKHAAAPPDNAAQFSFTLPCNGRVPYDTVLSDAIVVTGEAHVAAVAVFLIALDELAEQRRIAGDPRQIVCPQRGSAAKLAADKRPTEGQL